MAITRRLKAYVLALILVLVAGCAAAPGAKMTFQPTGLPLVLAMDTSGKWSVTSTPSKVLVTPLGAVTIEAGLTARPPSEGYQLIVRRYQSDVADQFEVKDTFFRYIWTSGQTMMEVDSQRITVSPRNTDTVILVTDTPELTPEMELILSLGSQDGSAELETRSDGAVPAATAEAFPDSTAAGSVSSEVPEPDGAKTEASGVNTSEPDRPTEPVQLLEQYTVVDNATVTTWTEAAHYCELRGGYLAVISSHAEDAIVYRRVREAGYRSAYFGYTDQAQEGQWVWIDGSSANYENWAPGEPNSENVLEDYAMYYWQFDDGGWNDGDFSGGDTDSGRPAFICELDN